MVLRLSLESLARLKRSEWLDRKWNETQLDQEPLTAELPIGGSDGADFVISFTIGHIDSSITLLYKDYAFLSPFLRQMILELLSAG